MDDNPTTHNQISLAKTSGTLRTLLKRHHGRRKVSILMPKVPIGIDILMDQTEINAFRRARKVSRKDRIHLLGKTGIPSRYFLSIPIEGWSNSIQGTVYLPNSRVWLSCVAVINRSF